VKPEPVTLEGNHVRLEPLTLGHLDALCEVGLEADLWRWTTSQLRTRDDMRKYLETAVVWQKAGTAVPFATVLKAGNKVIGSTRFANIEVPHRKAEIGWTWIGKPWQRSPVNTEAKYLMLRHAFEVWKCVRVELKTNALNQVSRRAIGRIGGQEEGTLRRHMINDDGSFRDTVYFSIIEPEWPQVKHDLEAKMARQ
jgi:RimJ/RimL family protein N-acetyltransferase